MAIWWSSQSQLTHSAAFGRRSRRHRARTRRRGAGAPKGRELLYWMDALAACLASHARDFDVAAPRAVCAAGDGERSVVRGRDNRPSASFAASETGSAVQVLQRRAERCAPALASIVSEQAESLRTIRPRCLRRGSKPSPQTAEDMFNAMEFDFLYEQERQLFAIGFRVEDSALDPNCYDLLASEARLASFIAIAKEEVPAKHWFKLGRTLAPIGRGSALISWSGSMFEYLMPSLVMRAPAGQHHRTDERSRRPSADQIRHGTGRSLGHLRVAIQRARHRRARINIPASACPTSATSGAWATTS